MDYCGKATIASKSTNKKSVEEIIKTKISECYINKKGQPTLQELADYLCDDNEVEYVIASEKTASIEHIVVGEATTIKVKLKGYAYEIEINKSIEIVSIKEIIGNSHISKETDMGVTHIKNNEWIASVPNDNWFSKQEYYSTDWEGKGTEESPYLIATEEELAGLSWSVANGQLYDSNTYFKLTKDLSMGKHIWIPIGGKDINDVSGNYYKYNTNNKFQGNFDGDNHNILGLYYNNDTSDYGSLVGLFGLCSYDEYNSNVGIKNINVIDSYISANKQIGGIVGSSSTYIKNSSNSSIIVGKVTLVGGIAGNGNDFDNCYNSGKIIVNSSDITVGGIVGSSPQSRIYNCGNSGEIQVQATGKVNVGGIAGYYEYIWNSYNIGNINVTSASTDSNVGRNMW